LTTRSSLLLMALSATPSRIPARIRNRVAAKCQVKTNKAANATMPIPPTDIAHARSLRAKRRSLADFATLIPFHTGFQQHSFVKRAPDQAKKPAGLTLACSLCKARAESDRGEADGMNFRWLGPLALLAVLVIAD